MEAASVSPSLPIPSWNITWSPTITWSMPASLIRRSMLARWVIRAGPTLMDCPAQVWDIRLTPNRTALAGIGQSWPGASPWAKKASLRSAISGSPMIE
jgi:hypothetical protein